MFEDLKKELIQLDARGRLRALSAYDRRREGTVRVGDKVLVDFASWDILGLRANPRTKRAAQQVIEEAGVGECSSRLSLGTSKVHLAFEKHLADFLGCESSLLFSSRNQAVFSLFTSLLGERDVVFVEDSQQGPVSDACYLVNTPVISFSPRDPEQLVVELERSRGNRRRVICVDVVSPLNGERLDLGALLAIAERFDAYLVADETAALGTIGVRGAGLGEMLHHSTRVLARYGSLAHAFGGYGGYVAASKLVVQYLLNRSKTFSAEISFPASIAASLDAGLDFVERSMSVRERVNALGTRLKRGLSTLGYSGVDQGVSPIIGIPLPSSRLAEGLAGALEQRGYHVEVLALGNKLSEQTFVRLLVNSFHSEKQVDALLQSFADLSPKLHGVEG